MTVHGKNECSRTTSISLEKMIKTKKSLVSDAGVSTTLDVFHHRLVKYLVIVPSLCRRYPEDGAVGAGETVRSGTAVF